MAPTALGFGQSFSRTENTKEKRRLAAEPAEHGQFLKDQRPEKREKQKSMPKTARATHPVCSSSVLN